MRFRRSVNLTIGQFSSVFKLLLYRIITGVIFFSLAFVILRYGLAKITESAELARFRELALDFFDALFTGQSSVLQEMPEAFRAAVSDFLALIGQNGGSIAGAIVGILLMAILARYFNGLANFALGETLNDRMSMNARTRFAAAYFRNFGKAALYGLVYVPLAFLFDLAIAVLCIVLLLYLPSVLVGWGLLAVLFAIFLSIMIVLCLQALKLAVSSSWMPAVIAEGLSVGKAIRRTGQYGKSFAHKFMGYLAASYLIFIVNAVCAVTTFGSALLITVPLSFIFLIAMQFVGYYTDEGKKFFVSDKEIADDTPANQQ